MTKDENRGIAGGFWENRHTTAMARERTLRPQMAACLGTVEEAASGSQLRGGEMRTDAHRFAAMGATPGERDGIGCDTRLARLSCAGEQFPDEG